MRSTRSDFARLLTSLDPVEAELARDLLSSEGIPSMLHSPYQQIVGLAYGGPLSVGRSDLLVPKTALARAREVFSETWDGGALTDEIALASPFVEEELQPSRSRSILWGIFVGLVVVAFILTYARYFWPRSPRPLFE